RWFRREDTICSSRPTGESPSSLVRICTTSATWRNSSWMKRRPCRCKALANWGRRCSRSCTMRNVLTNWAGALENFWNARAGLRRGSSIRFEKSWGPRRQFVQRLEGLGAMGLFLRPVAAGFGWGVALRRIAYRRGWFKVRRLATPVVSLGNLTVGGSGKTPLLAFTARKLAARGWKPGILTRGYGRQSQSPCVVLEPAPDRQPDPRESGDEPALLAQKLPNVPIVVSADRYKGGRLAEERFPVDVLLLDDGFQHLALARDVDIVLMDATEDWSAQSLLPAGRLREPYSALERAHLIVLTRLELGAASGLEDFVRGINPRAKVFHCSTRLSGLREISNGENIPLESILP